MRRASAFAQALCRAAPLRLANADVVVVVDVSGLGLAQLIFPDTGKHYGVCSDVAAAVVARFSRVDLERIDDVADVVNDQGVVVIGGMPWERQLDASLALLYACQRVRGAIAAVYPARARVMAAPVRFAELRNPLDIPRDIRGVAHGAVADAFREHCAAAAVSLDLSMYDFTCVGAPRVLARLDYAARELVIDDALLPFAVDSANALAVWVEWCTADNAAYLPSGLAAAGPGWHCDVCFLRPEASSSVRVRCGVDAATHKFSVNVDV